MHTPETPRPDADHTSPAAARRYELHIDDMHCASCVRRVEEAILAVPGVVEASVNLVEQSASVSGGDPEEVAAAVQQAGYGARVIAAATADRDYAIDILGMHCASCVRRVEEALLAVPGVVEAAVNLVEKRARVRGGDPEAAVQAVLAQGYGASLPAPAADLSFFLRLEAPPETDDVEQITDVLQARDGAAEVRFEDGRLRVSTAEHPADVLLRLNDLGYQATLEETYADPAVEQAGEARRPTQIVQDAPPDLLFFHLFDCTAGAAGAADRETTPMHAHAPAAD